MNRRTTTVFGLALIVLLCGAASAATTIYVPTDHAKIQWAVDNATAGDTIYVWNGTYNENVDIGTSHLTLEGEGANVVTVTAAASGDHVFHVTADYVNITGFNVTGATAALIAGVYLWNADNCDISDNIASDNSNGIHLQDSSNNTLIGNDCSGNGDNGIYLCGSNNNTLAENICTGNDGIRLQYSSSNTLIRNICTGNGDNGIRLRDSSDNNTLTENDCSGNNDNGIYLSSSSDNTLIRNICTGNGDDGIYLSSSSDNTLTENDCSDNNDGIYLSSSNGNRLSENDCSDNDDGIVLSVSSGNRLTGNDCSGNVWNGIDLSFSSNNTLIGNDCSGNTEWGFYSYVNSHNNTVEDLTVASYPTTISFTYGNGIALKGVETAPPDPAGKINISKYVNAMNVGDSWLFLNVSYKESDLACPESSLRMWRYDGAWSEVAGSGVNVVENYVYAYITEFSVFAPMGTGLPCDCGDICVSTSGWWRKDSTFNDNVTPIQAAVDHANSGETICVEAGAYTENVDIGTSHLTLAGEGANVVTVTAAASGDHVFHVTADYVNISGFHVTGATANWIAGVYLLYAHHCNIADNIATDNSDGIHLYFSSDNMLTGNNCSGNDNDGIWLYSLSNNNVLTGNNCSGNGDDGIELFSSSDNTLAGNNCSGNTPWDFYSNEYSHNNVIKDLTVASYPTTISFTYGDGIAIKGVDTAPGDPVGRTNIGKYVNAMNVEDSWLFLNVSYEESDLTGPESSLRMWQHDGTAWSEVAGSGVNVVENYVYAHITEFSVFAPMGDSSTTASAASTTSTGAPRDGYRVYHNVYATGSGFTTGTNVDIYVVPDRDWNDGESIPADVTGSVETVLVGTSGVVGPVLVWHARLVPGRYDIVIDADQDGVYDAATDGLDSGSPGFVVLASSPPTPPTEVPTLTPPGIALMIGLLAVVGSVMLRRRE